METCALRETVIYAQCAEGIYTHWRVTRIPTCVLLLSLLCRWNFSFIIIIVVIVVIVSVNVIWILYIMNIGLLDTITSTADSKDCPGVCVHTLATLICYEVLENVKCPSATMRCCVEPPPLAANSTTAVAIANKVDQTTPATNSNARPQVSEIPVRR